uniref:ATP-dependent Clp protease ATP-binding subunit n=1 Tax=Eubacterium cellulosolvens TaxID=29322 RepID=UPI00048A3F95|nr:ATP-dependent Clp protease ATP-binding subunit [[Eubacterium] cellulosolvens]
MNNQFTALAKAAISQAVKVAQEKNHAYVGTEHLLIGLLREKRGTASSILSEYNVDEEVLAHLVQQFIAPEKTGDVLLKPEPSPRAQNALDTALEYAASQRQELAGTEHILMAILRDTDCVASRLLFTMNVNIQKMFVDILRTCQVSEEEMKREAQDIRESSSAESQPTTPTLDQYSRDLTALAARHLLDPVVGRNDEINRVIQILSRRKKNNPCLIGEPGVGKTAIVEGLAQRIAAGAVPDSVKGKRLVVLDLSGMVAGSKYRGEFEERIKRILAEVMDNQNILLFIDEIHTIIGAGGAEGALDASNILKPSLARGEIQLIGATTIEEYRKHIEKDAALERRFQPVTVEQPSEEETLEILHGLRDYYEEHHGVTITDEALEAAVQMSTRYVNDRYQPDKAIDLIDEASASVQLGDFISGSAKGKEKIDLDARIVEVMEQKEAAIAAGNFEQAEKLQNTQKALEKKLERAKKPAKGKNKKKVTVDDIARTVSMWTKIPLEKIAEAESRRLARLEKILHARVIGQEEAVTAVSKAIRRGRVGLKDPGRPIGSFLFLGPTGVGKTELSKALADAVFGSEDAMIRVDMSEYMEKHSVSKLIGSPPGYVGYDEGGQLSEKVRRHPYSVILFDEIEKAHPDVFNILLQVLDDGHITDAQGRKISFKDTVIIMTSNAGANRIVQPKKLGFLSLDDEKLGYETMKLQVLEEVKMMFRPEFLNRIDEILVFHSLTREDMKKIVEILLKDLTGRCSAQLGIELRISQAVKDNLIDKSFDNKYGARPLRRAIQNRMEDALSEEILGGKINRGDRVACSLKDDKIVFSVVKK